MGMQEASGKGRVPSAATYKRSHQLTCIQVVALQHQSSRKVGDVECEESTEKHEIKHAETVCQSQPDLGRSKLVLERSPDLCKNAGMLGRQHADSLVRIKCHWTSKPEETTATHDHMHGNTCLEHRAPPPLGRGFCSDAGAG